MIERVNHSSTTNSGDVALTSDVANNRLVTSQHFSIPVATGAGIAAA